MTTITLQVVLFNTQKNSSSYLHKVTATGRFDMIDWKLAHYTLLLYYTHYVRYLLILQILQRLDPKVNSYLKKREKCVKRQYYLMFDQCSVDCKLITVCVHSNLRTCTERIPKQIKNLNRISTIYLHLGFFSNLDPLQNIIFSKGTS